MFWKIFGFILIVSGIAADDLPPINGIVTATKRLEFQNYPGAYNPSIFKLTEGFLVTFRYVPNPDEHWISYIGAVLLNEDLEPISEPELLETRAPNSKTPSQAEDARIFSYRGRLFLIYNDNLEILAPQTWQRRDMFMAELSYSNRHFTLSPPLKLAYLAKQASVWWQKNWVPFEYKKQLYLVYAPDPHEILYPNLMTGSCYHCYDTWALLDWNYGKLRGSTPPQIVDGEYLAFFHSGKITHTQVSWNMLMWHYFMGAYTFSAEPPFHITRISHAPIIAEGFYTQSNAPKRVVFPGGFVVSGSKIYLAYGKDDREIWIATLDKATLMESLFPVAREPDE